MQEVLSAGGPTYAMKWRAGRTAGTGGPAGRPSKNQCSKQWRAQTWPESSDRPNKSISGGPAGQQKAVKSKLEGRPESAAHEQ